MIKTYFKYQVFILILVSLAACELFNEGDISNITELEQEYNITRGACGTIVKQERLGGSFGSALSELEEIVADFLPGYDFRLEPASIEVENKDGKTPAVRFRSIRVLNKENNLLIYGLSDVLTSNGYYYKIHWCPEAPPLIPGE